MAALVELVGAAGLSHPRELRPMHILKRISPSEVKSFAEVYPHLEPGELLAGAQNARDASLWAMSRADSFAPHAQAQARLKGHAGVAA